MLVLTVLETLSITKKFAKTTFRAYFNERTIYLCPCSLIGKPMTNSHYNNIIPNVLTTTL